MSRYVVDAGPLIGYLDAGDQWNAWSVNALNSVDDVFHTSEAVVTEVAFRLGRVHSAVSRLLRWVRAGGLVLVPAISGQEEAVDALLKKYPGMDLCDATVVRLSELLPQSRVITTDRRHFQVYRRHRDQPIPLVCPP